MIFDSVFGSSYLEYPYVALITAELHIQPDPTILTKYRIRGINFSSQLAASLYSFVH